MFKTTGIRTQLFKMSKIYDKKISWFYVVKFSIAFRMLVYILVLYHMAWGKSFEFHWISFSWRILKPRALFFNFNQIVKDNLFLFREISNNIEEKKSKTVMVDITYKTHVLKTSLKLSRLPVRCYYMTQELLFVCMKVPRHGNM